MPFEIVSSSSRPVIAADQTIAGESGFGFEGGRVVRIGDTFHLMTTELVAEPLWSKTVFGHWQSTDGTDWTRVGSLLESSGDFSGKDRRGAYFSPMVIFDELSDRWQLFYVSYRTSEGVADRNHDGIIWRAQSSTDGINGIGGPYWDQDVVLRPGKDSQPWEGHQGTDSFFPYFAGGRWLGLYGSCDVENYPDCDWVVGLASAAELTGEWERSPEGNPIAAEPHFIENPVVTALDDGSFIAVYENDALDPNYARSIGVMSSSDGKSWVREQPVTLGDADSTWATRIRTPLSFIADGDSWIVFFTAFDDRGSLPGSPSFGNVGSIRVRRSV